MTGLTVHLHAWPTRFYLGLIFSQVICVTADSIVPHARKEVTNWEDHGPHSRDVQHTDSEDWSLSACLWRSSFLRNVGSPAMHRAVPTVRICNTTILMIRAIFFSTKGIAIVVIIGEYVTMKPCQCMSGREQIPPYSGHGNPQSRGQPVVGSATMSSSSVASSASASGGSAAFGLRNVSPQRDFNTQLQLQEGWERHSLPQRWVKGATGALRPGRVVIEKVTETNHPLLVGLLCW